MNKLKRIKVIGFNCGRECLHKFSVMGIRVGAELEIISKQPLNGPVTVKLNGSMLSVGQGMWCKLNYEEIDGSS